MAWVLLAAGLVLAVEGLIFALLPGRLEDLVRVISEMPQESRRMAGLVALGLGVVLIWIAKTIGI